MLTTAVSPVDLQGSAVACSIMVFPDDFHLPSIQQKRDLDVTSIIPGELSNAQRGPISPLSTAYCPTLSLWAIQRKADSRISKAGQRGSFRATDQKLGGQCLHPFLQRPNASFYLPWGQCLWTGRGDIQWFCTHTPQLVIRLFKSFFTTCE